MKTSALQIESVKIQNVCEKVVERLPFFTAYLIKGGGTPFIEKNLNERNYGFPPLSCYALQGRE